MTIKVDIVTAERLVYADDVDIIIVPGIEGEMGILPQHMQLMTVMQPGEIRIRKGIQEFSIVVTGGFLEVKSERVTILADAAERAEEIDIARAEAARKRAEDRLARHESNVDLARAEAALRRSLIRLRIAEKIKQRRAL